VSELSNGETIAEDEVGRGGGTIGWQK